MLRVEKKEEKSPQKYESLKRLIRKETMKTKCKESLT